MRFITKYINYRVIIDPKVPVRDHLGIQRGATSGFTAEFGKTGVFDSELAQRNLKWSDEERERYEQALLKAPECGTFFYAEQPDVVSPAVAEGAAPMVVKNPCLGTVVVPGEPSRVCGKEALPGSDYCAECAEDAVEVEQSVAVS